MMWLVDGNVLAAYCLSRHPDHARAAYWFDKLAGRFSTCSVTQGTLVRLHMRFAIDKTPAAAWRALAGIEAHPLHDYWDDDLPYRTVPHTPLQGHRQVTDAWLVELARRHGARVATLDHGMASAWPEIACLI